MYGKVNGKQLKDSTVDLLKLDLSGAQGTFLFATGSYLGAYEVPNIPQAFITKQYADSLASGLDPKESVYLVSVGNITPNGTVSVDGVTASLGKRILLAGQSSPIDNGIYVVGPGTWSRATDSDGDPGNEVSLGNYTFVERGTTFSQTGWVLYDTNSTGSTVSVGVETQLWTQFNGAGSFIWGNGLSNTGNNIYVDIAPDSGLTFSSTQLTVNPTIAGNGLAFASGILSVNTANGLTINGDNVEINSSAAGSGLAFSTGVFSVNTANGVTINGDNVEIDPSAAGSGLSFSAGVFSVNTANGVTINGDNVELASTVAGNGLSFSSGVISVIGSTAIGVNNDSIYVKYDPNTISIDGNGALTVISAGDAILDITAGRGISGNQLSGPTASLDVELTDNGGLTFSGAGPGSTLQVDYTPVASQLSGAGLINNGTTIDVKTGAGITISSDSVAVDYASVATQLAGNGLSPNSTTIDVNTSNGLTVSGDSVQIDPSAAGSGLSFSAGVFSVNTANGVTINGDNVELNSSVAGSGLSFTTGVININVVKGVTISSDALFSDAGTILTTSLLPVINIATNSTVQSALTAIDNYLSNVGAQEEIAISNSPVGTFLKTVNAPVNALSYTFSTPSDGVPHIYINGIYVKANSTTASSPAYFSSDGGVTGTTVIGTSSVLYLNPFILDFKLDPTDDVVVHYLTKTL